jgi:hypothetical protein
MEFRKVEDWIGTLKNVFCSNYYVPKELMLAFQSASQYSCVNINLLCELANWIDM